MSSLRFVMVLGSLRRQFQVRGSVSQVRKKTRASVLMQQYQEVPAYDQLIRDHSDTWIILRQALKGI